MNCKTCGKEYSPDCDYRQGRCPNHKSLFDEIMDDSYKTRFYNLMQSIKSWFK
jgi:DNA-directed RNA polymerase subunit RPC12/RpoP